MAPREGLQHATTFGCYLNQMFSLQTDHAALVVAVQNVFGQWFKSMAGFDFKLLHRSKSVYGNADALRCPS